MRILFGLLFFLTFAFSKVLVPTAIYKTDGGVNDIVVKDNLLYAATENSVLDIIDLNSKKIIKKIKVSKIKDFMGDIVESPVFNIDVIDDKILIMSQDENGYSRIHIYKNNKLNQIISKENHLNIVKAKFIDKDKILLGLLGSEVILYDINNRKNIWDAQVSFSKFSDFALNDKKDKVVVSDESGVLHIVDIKDGKVIKELRGINKDNVFQVDWKKNIIATAGKDRRCGVYFLDGRSYFKEIHIFVFAVGVSNDGKKVAFVSDEKNNISVFDSKSGEFLYKLSGIKAQVNKIYFVKNGVFIGSGKNEINYYKLY